jgi:hypothetical protein
MAGLKENIREDQKRIAALPNDHAQHMLSLFQELLAHRGIDISVISSIS